MAERTGNPSLVTGGALSTALESLGKILAAIGSSRPSKGYISFGVDQETASKTNGRLCICELEELFL